MRHGEALSPQVDPERGLTENGKKNIEKVAQYLKKNDISFKHIFHSKKKRARETADIMLRITSPNVTPFVHQNVTPNDDPSLIVDDINTWNEDTLIASHLPFVPNLMTLLTGQEAFLSAISFETGTLVCLEKNQHAGWELVWATSPSEI